MNGIMSTFEGAVLREYLSTQHMPQFAQLRQSIAEKLAKVIPNSNRFDDLSNEVNVQVAFTKNETQYIQHLTSHVVNAMSHAKGISNDELLMLNALKRLRNVVK